MRISRVTPAPARRLCTAGLLAALLAAAGCSESTATSEPSITGTWQDAQGSALDARINLTGGPDGSVTGSGFVNGREAGQSTAIAVDVNGTHRHPDVTITFSRPVYESFTFEGKFIDDNTISGTVQGAGFVRYRFIIARQR